MARAGRRRRGGDEHHQNEERWLLTYADMITLLMALFIVMFSISSVNTSKYDSLQKSLQDAFSGRILPGGRSIRESGGTDNVRQSLPSPPYPSLQPMASNAAAARAEQATFEHLRREIQHYAQEHGLAEQVSVRITSRGLLVRVLTDKLLFDSGSATIKPSSLGLLSELGGVLRDEGQHAVEVEGYTDTVPIHTGQFPSNWELSAARAASIVRAFIRFRVDPHRLTAAGRAYLSPVSSNDTPAGRSLNRRVEILIPRAASVAAPGGAPGSQVMEDLR